MSTGSQSSEAGTITADQFAAGAQHLAAAWNKHASTRGSWQWFLGSVQASQQDSGYLGLEQPLISRNGPNSPLTEGSESARLLDYASDDPMHEEHGGAASGEAASQAVASPRGAIHLYKYHILYHSSYCVPIMMFKAYQPDGQLLPWEQMLTDLPTIFSQTAASHDRWTFVTQQDHPYEMSPWHVLHPCGTEHAMQLMMASMQRLSIDAEHTATSQAGHHDAMYMLAWLSMVGPLVGLVVPPDLHCKLN